MTYRKKPKKSTGSNVRPLNRLGVVIRVAQRLVAGSSQDAHVGKVREVAKRAWDGCKLWKHWKSYLAKQDAKSVRLSRLSSSPGVTADPIGGARSTRGGVETIAALSDTRGATPARQVESRATMSGYTLNDLPSRPNPASLHGLVNELGTTDPNQALLHVSHNPEACPNPKGSCSKCCILRRRMLSLGTFPVISDYFLLFFRLTKIRLAKKYHSSSPIGTITD